VRTPQPQKRNPGRKGISYEDLFLIRQAIPLLGDWNLEAIGPLHLASHRESATTRPLHYEGFRGGSLVPAGRGIQRCLESILGLRPDRTSLVGLAESCHSAGLRPA